MDDKLDRIEGIIDKVMSGKDRFTPQQYMDMMVLLRGIEAKLPKYTKVDLDKIPWGIKEFEQGKWYVCRVQKLPKHWVEEAEPMFDGKPHLCIRVKNSEIGQSAEFKDVPGGTWRWFANPEALTEADFKEVPAPR